MTRRDPILLREIFLKADRFPEVAFYTSNDDKFLQARLVLQRSGLELKYFHTTSEPYDEDYSQSKEDLLTGAIGQVTSVIGRTSLVFVEDTSLRIEALSGQQDHPGLRVKEWFQETSFEALDDELKARGLDRRAVVKSDIALHVPGLRRPLFFHGETDGVIADAPPTFPQSPTHPWLSPASFNGWLIPMGSTLRLGEMDFEESAHYDFRVRALVELVDRIEELTAALNLPPSSYQRAGARETAGAQMRLFAHARSLIVVIGPLGAGKTTFGEHAELRHDLRFIEASDVMRALGAAYEGEDLSGAALARRVVSQQGSDAIALRCLEMSDRDGAGPVVITGFRLAEEVEAVLEHSPEALVVHVKAGERTRLERVLKRSRPGAPTSMSALRQEDREQGQFGLLRVVDDLSHVQLVNEGTLDEYRAQIDELLGVALTNRSELPTTLRGARVHYANQTYRSLTALESAGRPISTDEIERLTTLGGNRVRQNNANKVLKRVPALANRLQTSDMRVRYSITDHGRCYLRLLRSTNPPDAQD